jgi:hypothetical protein
LDQKWWNIIIVQNMVKFMFIKFSNSNRNMERPDLGAPYWSTVEGAKQYGRLGVASS